MARRGQSDPYQQGRGQLSKFTDPDGRPQAQRYTGHVMDIGDGPTYMQQRYYDPMGVFLSVDPVTAYDNGDMRHFNRYAYAYNNPYKFTDPDGRCANLCTGGVGAVVGAVVGFGVEGLNRPGFSRNLQAAIPAIMKVGMGKRHTDEFKGEAACQVIEPRRAPTWPAPRASDHSMTMLACGTISDANAAISVGSSG